MMPAVPTAKTSFALAPQTPVNASVVPLSLRVHGAVPVAERRMTPFCPTANDSPVAGSDQAPNSETSVSPCCSTEKATGVSGRGPVPSSSLHATRAPAARTSVTLCLTRLLLRQCSSGDDLNDALHVAVPPLDLCLRSRVIANLKDLCNRNIA